MQTSLPGTVLAAGRSRRFTDGNKLLATFRNDPLFLHGLRAIVRSRIGDIFVVTGPDPAPVQQALDEYPASFDRVRFVRNPAPERGQVSSIVTGFSQLSDEVPGTLVTPADMPFLRPDIIHQLLDHFSRERQPIVTPEVNGVWHMPKIIPADLFEAFRDLDPNTPGRTVVEENRDRVQAVSFDDEQPFLDVDTREELRSLQKTHE